MENKIQEYIQNASPIQWVEYAEELRDASEVIWKESGNTKVFNAYPKPITKPGLSRVYFLNIGYSLENLLKGLLITENPDLVKDGKIDPSISSGHRLHELANLVISFSFDLEEMELFKLLSEAIPSWSRYPIPKKWQINTSEKIINQDVRKLFLKIWGKIGFKIYEETKDGWDGPNGVRINNWRSSYFEGTMDFEIPKYRE